MNQKNILGEYSSFFKPRTNYLHFDWINLYRNARIKTTLYRYREGARKESRDSGRQKAKTKEKKDGKVDRAINRPSPISFPLNTCWARTMNSTVLIIRLHQILDFLAEKDLDLENFNRIDVLRPTHELGPVWVLPGNKGSRATTSRKAASRTANTYISLPSLLDYDVKLRNHFMYYWESEYKITIFLFSWYKLTVDTDLQN